MQCVLGKFNSIFCRVKWSKVSVLYGTELSQAFLAAAARISPMDFPHLFDLSSQFLILLDTVALLSGSFDPWLWLGIWTDHVCTFLLSLQYFEGECILCFEVGLGFFCTFHFFPLILLVDQRLMLYDGSFFGDDALCSGGEGSSIDLTKSKPRRANSCPFRFWRCN